MKLYDDHPSYGKLVVSAPCGSRAFVPKFPTTTGSGGSSGVYRGLDRKFAAAETLGVGLAPSVCVCTEFCAFRAQALKDVVTKWPPSPVALTRELMASGCTMAVPTCVLVERDPRLYSHVVRFDRGDKEAAHPPPKSHRVGIVDGDDTREKIVKFGSCRAATLTLQFL